MTVSSTATRWPYVGDNSTVNFPYNNKIFLSADLDVYLDDVLQTETTHYTVSGEGNEGGGIVTFVTPPPTASSVIIARNMPLTQETDIPNGGILLSNALENEFDRSRIADQQINEIAGRALKYPVTDQAVKKYDAEGLVIENVADGVAANDAVNKGQMDVAVTAAAGGVLPETILQTVATLAELQGRSDTVGTLVKTKGYYIAGDGGGASYIAVADGTYTDGVGGQSLNGSFVQGSGVQYSIQLGAKAHVLQFGAKGDDFTYDDAAFTRFISYIAATKKEPCFGGGTRVYRLVAAADVRDIEGVTWKGNGCIILIDPTVAESVAMKMGSSSLGGTGTASLKKQQYLEGINFRARIGNPLCKGALDIRNGFDIEIKKSVMINFDDHADAEVIVYDSGFNFKTEDLEIGFALQTDVNGNKYGFDKGKGIVLRASYLETSTIEIVRTTIYGGKYCVYVPEQLKTTDAITYRQCHFNRPYRYGVFVNSADGATAGGALRITSMKFEDVHFEGYLSDKTTVDPRPIYIDATTSNNDAGKGIYGLEINGLYLSGIQNGLYLKGLKNGCTIENVWYSTTTLTYSTIAFTGSSTTTYNVIELAGNTIAKIEGVWPQIQQQSDIPLGDRIQLRHVLAPSGSVVQRSGEGQLDETPLNRAVQLTPPSYKSVAPGTIGTTVAVDFLKPRGQFGTVNFKCATTGASAAFTRVFVSYDGTVPNEIEIARIQNSASQIFYGSFAIRLDAGKIRFRTFGGDVADNFEFWLTSVNYDGTNAAVVGYTGV